MDAVCERVRRVAVTSRHDDDQCVPDVETSFLITNIDIIMSESSSTARPGGGTNNPPMADNPADITPTLPSTPEQWAAVEVRN